MGEYFSDVSSIQNS